MEAYFREAAIPFYQSYKHTGILRHLVIRRSVRAGELLLNLVTTDADIPLAPLLDRLLALRLSDRISGILHTINDSAADAVKADRVEVLYGRPFLEETLLDMKFRLLPFSFFQTNSLGAEVLYQKVREYAGDVRDKVIYDLYSGTGTIAQLLAPVAKLVVGVELVEEAVRSARENAVLNGLTNCKFVAGDVLQVLGELPEKPDLIVLDPPREGVHPKALEKIISYGVNRMIYISCKPTSLARDLAVLQKGGYAVTAACGVDLFPQTFHVETVVSLRYQNPRDYAHAVYAAQPGDAPAAQRHPREMGAGTRQL